MTDFKQYTTDILKNINKLRDEIFLEYNYIIPENTNTQPKRKYSTKYKIDVKYTQYNIEKMKNQRRNKNKKIESIIEKDELGENQDILTDDTIFNVVENNDNLIKWKDIVLENKKNKIKEFINKKYDNFPIDTLDKIFNLIEINKINFKKYINFNELTSNINSLPIIGFKDGIYFLNYSSVKIKKRKKIVF